jgi:hypothetical protein
MKERSHKSRKLKESMSSSEEKCLVKQKKMSKRHINESESSEEESSNSLKLHRIRESY